MRALGATRSALLLGVLCLGCAVSGAIAIAAPGHPRSHRSHRSSRSAASCHRKKHRRCPPARSRKKSAHAKKPRTTSRRAKPKGDVKGSGSGSTWATVPAAVGPGSTPSPPAGAESPAGATPPAESPPAPAAPARVGGTAVDTEAFRFVLSRPSVPAGKVIIEFVNHGQDEHNLNAVEPEEGSLAGSIPNTAPNAHPSLTVDLRRGSYTLFCSLPGHEAKGMKATLVVY